MSRASTAPAPVLLRSCYDVLCDIFSTAIDYTSYTYCWMASTVTELTAVLTARVRVVFVIDAACVHVIDASAMLF